MNLKRHALPILSSMMLCIALPFSADAAESTRYTRSMNSVDRDLFASEGMLAAHPDFRWRMAGLYELDRGKLDLAHAYLTRAARYADKPAQAMLAELLWNGRGVARDPALAYAWMDLAAERGYVMFVAHREKYWNALTPQERVTAVEHGRDLYAVYGDEVAQPRLRDRMKRERYKGAGSRVGVASAVRVYHRPGMNPSGGRGVGHVRGGRLYVGRELPKYYEAKYWKPKEYFAWQDRMYSGLPESWVRGEVDVGELQPPREQGPRTRKPGLRDEPI